MITQGKLSATTSLIPLLALRNEVNSKDYKKKTPFSQENSFKLYTPNLISLKMDEDLSNASLAPCQDHPWLQRCGDTIAVDLCAGEVVPSPGKEDHVPSINELSATRNAERNSGRRNRRRHIRKQRKKSPTPSNTLHLDAIQIELDSPSPVETRNWSLGPYHVYLNEDSFLTDDEAEMDEDDNNNTYTNTDSLKFNNSNSWSTSSALEAGDVTSDSGLEHRNGNHDWFNCTDQMLSPNNNSNNTNTTNNNKEIWEESDELSDYSPRYDSHTSRLNPTNVLSTWMRVPCVGKQPMEFHHSIKKDFPESKKGADSSNLKSKKKRKKSKNGMRHFLASSQSEAANESQEIICSFNADALKTSKGTGPAKWFRKSKMCKSTTKILTNNNVAATRPLPVDSLQLPAPEGSILKRPVQTCQSKPKKKVRWASDLLQVRYFRSEPIVPSQYHTSPRRSSNRISSYDLDVLLFPWQEGNHSSRDTYMSFIQ